jgi:hypothetical protein
MCHSPDEAEIRPELRAGWSWPNQTATTSDRYVESLPVADGPIEDERAPRSQQKVVSMPAAKAMVHINQAGHLIG